MIIPTLLAIYSAIILALNLLSPVKVGIISWFQLLFIRAKLAEFSLSIKSISFSIRPMYLFHWKRLQATHHEGLFAIHISKLKIDVGAGSSATGFKKSKKASKGKFSPNSMISLLRWIRWVFPITVVIHSLEVFNSQIDDFENKSILLDSLTFSMTSIFDDGFLRSKFHLDITRLLLGKIKILKSCSWTCDFNTVLSNLEDIYFQDIKNSCITHGLNLEIESIQKVIKSLFPKKVKNIESEKKLVNKSPFNAFDIDLLLHKIRIDSIYFGLDDSSIVLDDLKVSIKDIAVGLNIMDRENSVCKRYSNLVLHKFTSQLTGLLIKATNLSNTSQFIEFTNVSSILDLKCIFKIAQNIDDSEMIKRLCSDDSFIARSFLTLANISFTSTLEDLLKQQFLSKKKNLFKPSNVNFSEQEESVDENVKSRRWRNILMVTHNIRTRVQLLTYCVAIKLVDDITLQLIIDDMLFDSSYTDNISSLFDTAEDAHAPIKAVVLNLRNFRYDILNENLIDRCVTMNNVQLSASLGINEDDNQIFVHDIDLDVDHIEMCIDNINLIKKMNCVSTAIVNTLQDYALQLDEISKELDLNTQNETTKNTKPSEKKLKDIFPKCIQAIHASIKSVKIVSCFTNPVRYFDGKDFTELNNFKRGVGIQLTNLTLVHDNTVEVPIFDVHLNHFVLDIIRDFDAKSSHEAKFKMMDLKHFKVCYSRLNNKLSLVLPILDVTYSVEALWTILFVKTVLTSLFSTRNKGGSKLLSSSDTPKKTKSSLNVVVTLHLLKMHVLMPSDVELAVELDSLVYVKLPKVHDYSMISFMAFRIYCQNPHTEGMWTLLMIWDDIKLKIKDNLNPGDNKIDMKCNAVRIEIPYEYIFYMAFDNLKALMKSKKIIENNFVDLMYIKDDETDFKTSKLMPSLVEHITRLPKIRIRSNHFIYCNHDDPFEEELTGFFMLGKLEQRIRIEKLRDFEKYESKMSKMLEDKYSHILKFKDGKPLMPQGYAEHLKQEKHFQQRMKRAATISSPPSSPLSPFSATVNNYTSKISPPRAGPAEETVSGSFQAWIQYKLDYHQAIEIPKSRILSNLSKSWITRVKGSKKSNTTEIENEYFKNRGRKDPGVRETFFKKFPIVSEGNSHPLFGFIVTNLDWIIDEPDFGVDNYKEFMHKTAGEMPMDMKYGIYFPMNWKLGCSHMKFQIKDYPLPMIGFGSPSDPPNSVMFSGDFVAFEQEFTLDEIRYNYVPLVSQYDQHTQDENLYAIHVPRTMTAIKFVTDWDIHVTSTANSIISWAPALQPGIKYAMNSFDLLSKPPLDISPKIGFWDKLPLVMHGRATFHFTSGLDLFIKSSQSPYELIGRSTGFLFRWSDETKLKINSTGKSEELLVVESNSFEIAIPIFGTNYFSDLMSHGSGRASDYSITKSVLKLSSKPIIWKLGFKFERNLFQQQSFEPGNVERTSKFRPHYDVRLKNPITFVNDEEQEAWDSYEGWRSDYIFMALSIHSKDETGYKGFPCCGDDAHNTLCLTPLTILHFFFWWNAFKSSLGLPIKEGPLFANNKILIDTVQSPKFGEHLFGISYSVILSPLYLAHVYRHVSNSKEQKVAFTGLKCFVKSFNMDMHQTKGTITIFDETKKEVRKESHLKMNKGVVDFIDADLRILSAVFDQKHAMANLTKKTGLSPSSSAFQDSSSSDNSEFINDKNWYDKNDYIELEAVELPPEEPKWKMLLFASSPRFYYIRDEEVKDALYSFDEIESSTHNCQIGGRHVAQAPTDLVDSRIKVLEEIIEVHKSQLQDIDTKPISDIAKKMKVKLETELYELHHRLHILHNLKDNFLRGIFPQYDEFLNDFDISDSEDEVIRTQSNALSRISTFSSQSNITRLKSRISTAPIKTSSYRNRFIVYGINAKWTRHTKRGFMSYLAKVKDRQLLVFSTSQKAVNLAEDLCKAHNSIETNTKPDQKDNDEFADLKFDADHEFSSSQEIIDDINELLNSTLDTTKADDSYLMKFVLPQISCSINDKNCVLITSNRIVLRNVTIEEFQTEISNSDGNFALPIEQRVAITLDDAFVYVLDRKDMINGVYNLFNTNDLAWPPCLPLEMYYSPASLDNTIVLQNLSCALFMVKPNSLHYSKDEKSNTTRNKTTTKLIIPEVQIVCDSKQFGVMLELFKAMTTTEKSEIQTMRDSVKNFIQFSDFVNYEQVLERLVDMQNECRSLKLCRRLLTNMNLSTGVSPDEMNDVNIELERLFLNLNGTSDFLRTLKAKKYNDSFDLSDWSIVASSIQIKLIDSANTPFVEVEAEETIYKFTKSSSGSSINTVYVSDFVINDRHPNAIYDTVLKRLGNSKTPMFLMDWRMAAPVGGIPVLNSKSLTFSPLNIAVDTRMTSELQNFIFPESSIVNSQVFDDFDDFENETGSDNDDSFEIDSILSHDSIKSVDTTSSKHSGGLLRKSLSRLIPSQLKSDKRPKESNSRFPSPYASTSDSDSTVFSSVVTSSTGTECGKHVNLMKSRAKKYYSAHSITINPTKLCVTFKGQGKLSLINLSGFVVTTPNIEIRNRIISNEELFAVVRNKMVRTVLNNSLSLIKSKLKFNKNSKKPKSAVQTNNKRIVSSGTNLSKDGNHQHHHHHHLTTANGYFKDVDLLGPSALHAEHNSTPRRLTLSELVVKRGDGEINEDLIFQPVEEAEEEEEEEEKEEEEKSDK